MLRMFLTVPAAAILVTLAAAGGVSQEKEEVVDPKVVDMPRLILVGMVQGAPDVGSIDIAALWQRFAERGDEIENAVEGTGYELHIQTDGEPTMHFTLVGVRVTDLGDVPLEMFHKVLPPCTYAVFTHRVVDGYAALNDRVRAWLESSDYGEAHPFDFQLYDARFRSMDDPESLQDIYVPVGPE
jgi:predicted transcriptional regulator YdeE